MAAAVITIRERVQGAAGRIRRVKRLDRLATWLITLGGLMVIVAVSFIFVFILAEAIPIFRPSTGEATGIQALPPPPPLNPPAVDAKGPAGAAREPARPLLVGGDEYQMFLYELWSDGRIALYRSADASLSSVFSIPAIAGTTTVTAASRSLSGDFLAAGTADGRVALQQVRFRPRYEQQKLVDLEVEVRDRGAVAIDGGRPVRDLSYEEHEGRKAVAALVGDSEIALVRWDEEGAMHRDTIFARAGERLTHVRLSRTETLAAASERGTLTVWTLEPSVQEVGAVGASTGAITAMEYAQGGNSLLVGDGAGDVSSWIRVRLREEDSHLALVRSHSFAPQDVAIRAIGRTPRNKSFVTAGDDGSLALRHLTSERTLVSFPGTGGRADFVTLTPKGDGILAVTGQGLARYSVSNPHPETSWTALFGKVWYEGYAKPEYVWQSTGATDDFEAKLSLIPVIFGTIKGTFYALVFAVPIAILGALYTSQFMHPSIRARIKPTVEIMAALPSVVVGFVAGLWLASRVERAVVPVLLMTVFLPAFGTAGILLWSRLPAALARRLRPGTELWLILPLLALGGWAAMQAGPVVESAAFGGDFKQWLNSAWDLVYDQRNSLVVGIAMGFAVIPIIFTIAEDSFSSVPSHLTAASLAVGASRWQTAVRVVLPTASPGVFSAVMIGFGRAIGETMIVLMATGNTPVFDWSIFNGMRTLSANIAVEIPEAPVGGTLYRTLFLAALVLFAMTFVVNTLAEVVRQRLRERYRAL